jgi:alpha-methylacyl-CoA racemase
LTGQGLETAQFDVRRWPELKDKFAALFRTRTRAEWCALLEGTDVCFAPVLNLGEAMEHPHNRARQTYVEIDGVRQPAPAPRFSATPAEIGGPPAAVGADTQRVLESLGFSGVEAAELARAGVV